MAKILGQQYFDYRRMMYFKKNTKPDNAV